MADHDKPISLAMREFQLRQRGELETSWRTVAAFAYAKRFPHVGTRITLEADALDLVCQMFHKMT
ncbi:MAG: hypothetical protein GXP62_04210, partial [Oligoflexia bacterium]|nr:hypothetical protein [Oligoflexia bacterium]